jgi:hypothetical protein
MKVADHSPNVSEGSCMRYRTLGRTGIEGGEVPFDERQTGL